jgi:hypothetical protein
MACRSGPGFWEPMRSWVCGLELAYPVTRGLLPFSPRGPHSGDYRRRILNTGKNSGASISLQAAGRRLLDKRPNVIAHQNPRERKTGGLGRRHPVRMQRVCEGGAQKFIRMQGRLLDESTNQKKHEKKKVSREALLTFADDGHILPGYFPGDIDSFALPNCRLRVMGRYVHDPASIGSAA